MFVYLGQNGRHVVLHFLVALDLVLDEIADAAQCAQTHGRLVAARTRGHEGQALALAEATEQPLRTVLAYDGQGHAVGLQVLQILARVLVIVCHSSSVMSSFLH